MDDPISAAVGAALRADLPTAVAVLRDVDPATLAAADRDLRARMLDRFDRSTPPPTERVGDADVERLLATYHDYWWHALLRTADASTLVERLRPAVETIIGGRHDTIDDVETATIAWLEAKGLHALMGVTSPLHELMIWRRQDTRTYDVELPEGRQTTRVELLDDFVCFGWAEYATCGRRATGGWATTEALFAVVPRYEDGLDGEPFEVTFLGHESQHYADLRRFGELDQWVLEYRAKLVELAQSDTSRDKLLGKFTESQSDDPGTPHAYANRRVLQEIRERLRTAGAGEDLATVAREALRDAALAALHADTATRTPVAVDRPAP